MSGLVRNRDFLGGLVLIALASFFLVTGWGLRTGSLTHMGPGFLPRAISLILLGMGVIKLGVSLVRASAAPDWPKLVPTTVVALLPVGFGLLIRPLGIVLTVALVVVLSRFAMREAPRLTDLVAGLLLGGFCALTFVVGLGQAMSIWPDL